MKIGFLGAGRMAEALVPPWVAAGHEVIVGGRTPEKTADLAARVGARSATLREASEEAQVLVLGVLYAGVAETLAAAGAADGVLRGKILVDVNNPVETEHFQLVDDFTPSLAEHLARVTGADVVKALNQVHRDVWSRRATYGGRPLVVPVATDSAAAREVADRLVLDAGATPFDAGPLAQARNIEAMTAVIIRHLYTGGDALSAFQLTVAEATSEVD
jgi:predicted dinucleotide-binding enzyme